MLPPIEELEAELRKTIEWAIEQGQGSYVLNENSYPYKFGYTLWVVKKQTGPVIRATSVVQLHAALAGEEPGDLPSYNIDWDLRSELTDNICYRKNEGLIMGTFDFNTAEEGAKIWAKQLHGRTPKWVWTTDEEKKKMDAEINQSFQAFYDSHCADEGDCPLKITCEVRWPGGFGLRGCRITDFADGTHYKTHMATEETLKIARAIREELIGKEAVDKQIPGGPGR